jgi:hypothetical protein
MDQLTVAQLTYQLLLRKLLDKKEIDNLRTEEAFDNYANKIGLNAYCMVKVLTNWSPTLEDLEHSDDE